MEKTEPEIVSLFMLHPYREIWLREAERQLEDEGAPRGPATAIPTPWDVRIRAANNWWWSTGKSEYGARRLLFKFGVVGIPVNGPPAETVAPNRIWFEAWGERPK